ncbi:MAG: dTDP-4-dehydrorhamnose reductase [Pseudomonadales bacterium]
MTTLVLGSTGQVGSHLRKVVRDAVFWSRGDADLTDPAGVEARVVAAKPTALVNAAAYTAVDRAESEASLAWRVNADAAAAIARAAATLDIPLVHISTDYVFDGSSERAYLEHDATNPLSVYGRSKLAGDLATVTLCPRSWTLRTSWVFSEHGANFVKSMLRLAGERNRLNIVDDQRGRPTYAGHIADVIGALLARLAAEDAPLPGIFHVSGGPVATWFEFAGEIFEQALPRGLVARVPVLTPITTADYPTPARRPANSILEPSRGFLSDLGVTVDWQKGLRTALDALSHATGAIP